MLTIVEAEYPQLRIAAEKGKYVQNKTLIMIIIYRVIMFMWSGSPQCAIIKSVCQRFVSSLHS